MSPRQRADRVLVERGLFESRTKAQAAIAAGLVSADDRPVYKASDEISVDAVLRTQPAHPYVSRGGVKLADALGQLGIAVAGRVCLDVGASTGGFTEVLLAHGARCVYAVDVGCGQLHPRLQTHPCVVAMEKTDIRRLEASRLPDRPEIIVADVSFISLKHVLPAALGLAAERAHLLALVKPQFEAPRGATKKGVVRDPAVHAWACEQIVAAIRSLGWTVSGVFPSVITGADGNREFFVGARRY